MEKQDFIKIAKEKSLYKYRGKVIGITRVSENIVNCLMFKTATIAGKSTKVNVIFSCFGKIGNYFEENYKKNDRLKIRFRIKAVNYHENKFINICTVVEHEIWRLNEDKIVKQERIEKINKSIENRLKGKQTGIKFNDKEWQ